MKKLIFISCFLPAMVIINSCAVNPVSGKKQVVFMSEEQEIAMGKESDPQIVAQYGLNNDTALQNYFSLLGKKMAAISHRPDLNYEFKVLDSDVLNAFAVPGGYVYFTRGIMAYFNNEAELAGVLGHEIGHIAARHSVAQQRNMVLGQLGIIAGVIISPEFAQYAGTASQGLGLLFLKFGRDAERESDQLGVEYSSQMGYNATEMAEFFLTLQRKDQESESAALPGFLSTHPDPGDRYTTVSKLATDWKKKLNLTDPIVNRSSYLRRIDGLIYGEDPKQGFVENNVFYHPVLKFQLPIPVQWQHQNSPQNFQMAPKDGKALMVLSFAPGNTLQEAASTVLQQNKLTVVESSSINLNGLPALVFTADQQQEGGTIRTLSYFIQYGGSIYHLIGVSSLANFNNYSPSFSASMQNFRVLTDAAKLNKKPERVHVKTVSSTTTLAQALRSYKVPENRLEELAVLNGMKLTDQVAAGTLFKIVQE